MYIQDRALFVLAAFVLLAGSVFAVEFPTRFLDSDTVVIRGDAPLEAPEGVRILSVIQSSRSSGELAELIRRQPQLERLQVVGRLDLTTDLMDAITGLEHLQNLRLVSPETHGDLSLLNKLRNLPQLTSLGVGGEGLSRVPSTVFQLPRLRSLWLTGMRIDSLSATLELLPELRELSVGRGHYGEDVLVVPRMSKIEILVLTLTPFTAVEISGNSNLRVLGISSTPLQRLVLDGATLQSLELLRVADSQLAELDVTGAVVLRRLELWGNLFTSVPRGVSSAAMLEELNLRDNPLTTIDLDALPRSLRELSVEREVRLISESGGSRDLRVLTPEAGDSP